MFMIEDMFVVLLLLLLMGTRISRLGNILRHRALGRIVLDPRRFLYLTLADLAMVGL